MAQLVARWVEHLIAHGERRNLPNGMAYSLTEPAERYVIDFADDFASEGWQQFDTDQDAHYFGQWVNPRTGQHLSYCEGDWALVCTPTVYAYNAEIRRLCDFYDEGQVAVIIDTDRHETTVYRQNRRKFLVPEPQIR